MRRILFILFLLWSIGAIAGGHAEKQEIEATSAAHADDDPVPTPVASTEPRQPVTGGEVVYGKIGDVELKGYLARPKNAEPGIPGLIVIHEWWGLNDNIRMSAERLAGEGYVALAVDLYDGNSATIPKEAIKLMTAMTNDSDTADENLRQANQYLEQELSAPKTGSIGWCLGGKWSLRTAVILPDTIDAAVMYYGNVTLEDSELEPLQMPLLGNFASNDPVVPLDSVQSFIAKMDELGKDADIKIYEGAGHGFSNPSGMAYNAEAATDAWARSTEFLAANLK